MFCAYKSLGDAAELTQSPPPPEEGIFSELRICISGGKIAVLEDPSSLLHYLLSIHYQSHKDSHPRSRLAVKHDRLDRYYVGLNGFTIR